MAMRGGKKAAPQVMKKPAGCVASGGKKAAPKVMKKPAGCVAISATTVCKWVNGKKVNQHSLLPHILKTLNGLIDIPNDF